MKRPLMIIGVLSLIAAACLPVFAAAAEMEHHHGTGETPGLAPSGRLEDGVRVIDISASRYKFEPDPIVVKSGEKVRLVVTSQDTAHGLAIGDFNVNLAVPAGETKSVEFVAGKTGTFRARCSVYCGPGHQHMRADLIVQ